MIQGIDLHTHLEGSCPAEVLNGIRHKRGLEPMRISRRISGLSEFSTAFGECSRSLVCEEDFEEATRKFLLFQNANNVLYTEFRVSPYSHVYKGGKDIRKIMAAIRNGVTQAFEDTGVYGRALIDGARHHGSEHLLINLQWAIDFYDPDFLVGFGIGGIEQPGDLDTFEKIYSMADREKIPISAHAGEARDRDTENIATAIRISVIRRIGHALGADRLSPQLISELIDQNKLIEVCLGSNLRLEIIDGVSEHPLPEWYEKGIPFGICTDDSTISYTNHSQERSSAKQLLQISDAELQDLQRRSMAYAFCSDTLKQHIMNSLLH